MSVHLVQCAARLPLKPGEKLVLLCLAENANGRDARAFPGLATLMAWSGLSRARVFEILKTLAELRLIEQVGVGHRGRAAEFVVLPYGCCPVHGGDEFGSAGPDAFEMHRGSDAPDPSDACGKSDTSDPFRAKGSTEPGQRVQSHAQERVQPTGPPPRTTPNNQTPSGLPPSTGSPGDAREDVVDLLIRLAKNDTTTAASA